MSKIKRGTRVPDSSLPMSGGGTWSLQDASGRKRVIYFYPRDMTAGCTREARDFRDLYGRKYLGLERSTLLLDGGGRLQQEWRKVQVPEQAEEVLEAAQGP